ncbi:hypothetical protein COU37_01590 [Candidatus Micrarchaeota archaeon CG10_big_fil_rev_8_21_14_0_10_45_29]|nr:MAG: hypothetical protein COU37_01590 [Candidatus Micrarchaeota archaeon CG10_big_fil_rev_8_21_14_0_10_45_29]
MAFLFQVFENPENIGKKQAQRMRAYFPYSLATSIKGAKQTIQSIFSRKDISIGEQARLFEGLGDEHFEKSINEGMAGNYDAQKMHEQIFQLYRDAQGKAIISSVPRKLTPASQALSGEKARGDESSALRKKRNFAQAKAASSFTISQMLSSPGVKDFIVQKIDWGGKVRIISDSRAKDVLEKEWRNILSDFNLFWGKRGAKPFEFAGIKLNGTNPKISSQELMETICICYLNEAVTGIKPSLMLSIISTESNFEEKASTKINARGESYGEGIVQLLPITLAGLNQPEWNAKINSYMSYYGFSKFDKRIFSYYEKKANSFAPLNKNRQMFNQATHDKSRAIYLCSAAIYLKLAEHLNRIVKNIGGKNFTELEKWYLDQLDPRKWGQGNIKKVADIYNGGGTPGYADSIAARVAWIKQY